MQIKRSEYGKCLLRFKLKKEFDELKQEKLEEIIAEINFLLVKNSTGSLTYNPERQKYVYNP